MTKPLFPPFYFAGNASIAFFSLYSSLCSWEKPYNPSNQASAHQIQPLFLIPSLSTWAACFLSSLPLPPIFLVGCLMEARTSLDVMIELASGAPHFDEDCPLIRTQILAQLFSSSPLRIFQQPSCQKPHCILGTVWLQIH